jgi:excisionase family DNA binding protein
MSALATALLAELSAAELDHLAELLAPRLSALVPTSGQSAAWLNVDQAAAHVACPKSRVYALVSSRRIPHHRDGSRLLFSRAELDDWVRSGGAKRP